MRNLQVIFHRNRILIMRILIVALISILIGILLPTLIPAVVAEFDLDCVLDEQSGEVIHGEDITKIRDRLREAGLKESRYMGSTGIEKHIQHLCDGIVSLDTLYTYADQLDMLAEVGKKYGQVIPVTVWDVQTSDMRVHNLTEVEAVDMLITSEPDYVDLLARAYNRFYTLKQNSTSDTALDAGLDIFLYAVDYQAQITDIDVEAMDTQTADEIGKEIVRVWQLIIGSTPRINPLTNKPVFPYNAFTHFNVTDMWRHHTARHTFIGLVWGVSGFDERFVGDAQNTNQVEHMAVSTALQYVYDTPILMLNAFEIRDLMSGGQGVEFSQADQRVNTVIATQFLPRFGDDYVSSIEFLRCILSSDVE